MYHKSGILLARFTGNQPSAGIPKSMDGEKDMKNKMMLLLVKAQDMLSREEGQDLVEYGLLIALISFGAIAGMQNLAGEHQHRVQRNRHDSHRRGLAQPTLPGIKIRFFLK